MAKLSGKFLDDIFASDVAVGDGVTTDFMTANAISSASSVDVYLNGLHIDDTKYSVNTGTDTISFVTAPATAQTIEVKYVKRT